MALYLFLCLAIIRSSAMPKMMYQTLQIGIPAIAVRALFFGFSLMIRSLNLVVDQVYVDLDTVNCLSFEI